jgi:hypothetical protein
VTTDTTGTRVTGKRMPASEFRLHQTSGTLDNEPILQVLRGELAAYRVRGYVPEDSCKRIAANFSTSRDRSPRYGEGEDGVEGYIVGASHIDQTTDEYLDDVATTAAAVADLYEGTADPLQKVRKQLLDTGGLTAMRPARHGGRPAGDSKAVQWNNTGEFLLLPHDDLSQLSDPIQSGFEIQALRRVMAINVYPLVPPGTGSLKVWNIEPDDRCRTALGLLHSGYPYPPEFLDDLESLVIPLATGDVVFLNGNLIHAVLGAGEETDSPAERLLLTSFTGLDSRGEFLWWT